MRGPRSRVRILSAVEVAFEVRFKPLEVLKLKTVGDLQSLIDKKLESA
jgi:acyl carrier protein